MAPWGCIAAPFQRCGDWSLHPEEGHSGKEKRLREWGEEGLVSAGGLSPKESCEQGCQVHLVPPRKLAAWGPRKGKNVLSFKRRAALARIFADCERNRRKRVHQQPVWAHHD